jgi:hypothetical protein
MRRRVDQGGAIAQLGERLVCNQKVAGSIPAGSTIAPAARLPFASCDARDDASLPCRAFPAAPGLEPGDEGSRDRAVPRASPPIVGVAEACGACSLTIR